MRRRWSQSKCTSKWIYPWGTSAFIKANFSTTGREKFYKDDEVNKNVQKKANRMKEEHKKSREWMKLNRKNMNEIGKLICTSYIWKCCAIFSEILLVNIYNFEFGMHFHKWTASLNIVHAELPSSVLSESGTLTGSSQLPFITFSLRFLDHFVHIFFCASVYSFYFIFFASLAIRSTQSHLRFYCRL